MKRAWVWWCITTALLAGYVALGLVASHTSKVDIKLTAGTSATLTLVRLAEDQLRMELMFRGDHQQRPELGEFRQKPGAAIRIAASANDADRVIFDATPKTGYGTGTVFRNLTSDLSHELGVDRWPRPPDVPLIVLHPGFTKLKLEVISVEPPLVGETVRLLVHPALGFKSGMSNVGILWGWFFWPLMLIGQIGWALVLLFRDWRRARA